MNYCDKMGLKGFFKQNGWINKDDYVHIHLDDLIKVFEDLQERRGN